MNRKPVNRLPSREFQEDELDRGLSRILADDPIAASSGFTERVMASVGESAATPPPLAFPWKLALPAFGAALAILVYAVLHFIAELRQLPPSDHSVALLKGSALVTNSGATSGWVALALAVAFLSVRLCLHLAAPKR